MSTSAQLRKEQAARESLRRVTKQTRVELDRILLDLQSEIERVLVECLEGTFAEEVKALQQKVDVLRRRISLESRTPAAIVN